MGFSGVLKLGREERALLFLNPACKLQLVLVKDSFAGRLQCSLEFLDGLDLESNPVKIAISGVGADDIVGLGLYFNIEGVHLLLRAQKANTVWEFDHRGYAVWFRSMNPSIHRITILSQCQTAPA
jgi:hypothetical protein